MCEPVTIAGLTLTATQTMMAASLAVSVASGVAGFVGSAQSAAAQADFEQNKMDQQNQYMLDNAEAANKAYVEEAAAENIRLGQEQDAASLDLLATAKQRAEMQGTAVASSEAAGLSLDLLNRDFLREEANYRNTVERQLKNTADQGQRTQLGLQAKAQDRVASAQPYTPSPVSSPSLLGTGLQIAGSAFSTYERYSTKDPITGKRTV